MRSIIIKQNDSLYFVCSKENEKDGRQSQHLEVSSHQVKVRLWLWQDCPYVLESPWEDLLAYQ